MRRGFLNRKKGKEVISIETLRARVNCTKPGSRPVESDNTKKVPDATQDAPRPDDENLTSYKKDQRIIHQLKPLNLDSNDDEIELKAYQFTEESPHDNVNYEHHELICTTLPAQLDNATRASNPDGWAECLVTGFIKNKILNAPSFPQPLLQPDKRVYYRGSQTESTKKPLPGLYAKRELQMGDLIFSERPVLVVPALTRGGDIFGEYLSPHEAGEVIREQWPITLKTALSRLIEEDREAFWKLRDIHEKKTGGKKSIIGIVKTNGFRLPDLEDPGLEDGLGAYSGVCLELSQINHSCRPNAERYWDTASFSMQLRATRKIAKDEEVTVSFINLLEPYATRQAQLKNYDIVCTCPSCKKPKLGDRRREQFIKGTPTTDDFTNWLKNSDITDDHIIKRSLVQISLLEDDGHENSPHYETNLMMIMLCYTALGNEEMAMRWGKKLGSWKLSHDGPKSADEFQKPERYTKHELWKRRVYLVNNLRASTYALNERIKSGNIRAT
ncbi:hypothetical protein GYMLUDRAFT_79483 [Collybiopsis luxurians FD-317 M1]|nr:hypothetical protein GYMLUDRAFT_79483 [Collybiopsis luxurians FD-317 M1]